MMKTAPSPRSSSTTGRIDQESESPRIHTNLNSQQQLLFLLIHASKCTANPGQCKHTSCLQIKNLLVHIRSCKHGCYRCTRGRALMKHYRRCQDDECEICAPVHEALMDEYWKGTRRQLTFTNERDCDAVKRKLTF